MSATLEAALRERIIAAIDEQRLVATASALVDIPSPTGSEQQMAECMRDTLEGLGLAVSWQEVEDGRPDVVGRLEGSGGGPSLMFNGHMDTSYSGREPHLRSKPGFQPHAEVRDGHIWGLGILNMKGALACYVEAVRAIADAGVRLRGDVVIAAVVGEIEKTQWGEEFRGASFRGYAAGSRYLPTHGGIADMCILGEPTEQRVVLGHDGTMWARISTQGPFVHTAFTHGRLAENAIVRMHAVLAEVLEWIPQWQRRSAYGGIDGVVNVGALSAGAPWRVSRTPTGGPLPRHPRAADDVDERGARGIRGPRAGRCASATPSSRSAPRCSSPHRERRSRSPIPTDRRDRHRSPARLRRAPARDTVRWFSDASALTRYGIETVNYGTSSGLPSPDGENLEIAGLRAHGDGLRVAATALCGESR